MSGALTYLAGSLINPCPSTLRLTNLFTEPQGAKIFAYAWTNELPPELFGFPASLWFMHHAIGSLLNLTLALGLEEFIIENLHMWPFEMHWPIIWCQSAIGQLEQTCTHTWLGAVWFVVFMCLHLERLIFSQKRFALFSSYSDLWWTFCLRFPDTCYEKEPLFLMSRNVWNVNFFKISHRSGHLKYCYHDLLPEACCHEWLMTSVVSEISLRGVVSGALSDLAQVHISQCF